MYLTTTTSSGAVHNRSIYNMHSISLKHPCLVDSGDRLAGLNHHFTRFVESTGLASYLYHRFEPACQTPRSNRQRTSRKACLERGAAITSHPPDLFATILCFESILPAAIDDQVPSNAILALIQIVTQCLPPLPLHLPNLFLQVRSQVRLLRGSRLRYL